MPVDLLAALVHLLLHPPVGHLPHAYEMPLRILSTQHWGA